MRHTVLCFFSILFVFYKGTALLEADGARGEEQVPVRDSCYCFSYHTYKYGSQETYCAALIFEH